MKYISPRGIALGCFTFILLFQSAIAHAEIIACNLTRKSRSGRRASCRDGLSDADEL